MLQRPDRAIPSVLAVALLLAGCGSDSAPEEAAQDTAAATATGGATAPDTEPAGPLVNPNEADATTLAAVPGLDSAAVALILEGRPFETMIPLHHALSARMDSAALQDVYGHMFIPLDLNNAIEEEILLIPGVGPRMAYEFQEYRPYEAIERFRREIGKYVDDQEVARLERYVVIR